MTLPDVPGGVAALAALDSTAMNCPSAGTIGVNAPCGPRLLMTCTLLPGATVQPASVPDSKPPLFSSVTTTLPTSVVPPTTGAKLPERPVCSVPLIVADAVTTMLPRTVATPGIENVPSFAVVDVRENVDTMAPPTPAPFMSITRPVTVVPGSGMTFTTTLGRSEERRVGKECRVGWAAEENTK